MGGQLVLFHIYLKTFRIKMINNNTIISDFLSANLGYTMFCKVPGGINRSYAVRNRTIVYDFINTRVYNQVLVNLKLK
jgi:hypothetical protein